MLLYYLLSFPAARHQLLGLLQLSEQQLVMDRLPASALPLVGPAASAASSLHSALRCSVHAERRCGSAARWSACWKLVQLQYQCELEVPSLPWLAESAIVLVLEELAARPFAVSWAPIYWIILWVGQQSEAEVLAMALSAGQARYYWAQVRSALPSTDLPFSVLALQLALELALEPSLELALLSGPA